MTRRPSPIRRSRLRTDSATIRRPIRPDAFAMTTAATAAEIDPDRLAADAAPVGGRRSRRRSDAAPSPLADYYELTKPRMNFLVVVTTAVGFFLAAGASAPWFGSAGALLLHALLGTALTAAGASALNCWLERDHDAKMPRTARRPVPAGRVSPGAALAFGTLLGVAGVAYLALLVNPLTAGLGAFTLASYVFAYTPLKRVTPLCTVVGAVPGAIPPAMGVTAATGELNALAWCLFGLLFVWQMPHFYALAILFKDDYAAGGFKMLPETAGVRATANHAVAWALALLPVTVLPSVLGQAGWGYAVAAVALGGAFLWTAAKLATGDRVRADAKRVFVASILYLPALLAALMLGAR